MLTKVNFDGLTNLMVMVSHFILVYQFTKTALLKDFFVFDLLTSMSRRPLFSRSIYYSGKIMPQGDYLYNK